MTTPLGRPYTERELQGRADLSRFTPEQPLFVGPNLYAALMKEPALADMMDRVRLSEPLPISFR